MTDSDVIARSLVDGETFALLFDRHYTMIERFLRARVGSALAEDLASETFAIAFRRRAAYDLSRLDARPWLYGIAVNLLREHRRGEERRLRAYARAAREQDAELESRTVELDASLAAGLLRLNPQERNLILLYAWAELSYEQLAEALVLPVGTVRSRLARARGKLRDHLRVEPAHAEGGQIS